VKIIQLPDGNQHVEAEKEELDRMEGLIENPSDKLTDEARIRLLRLLGDAAFTRGDPQTAVGWYARYVQEDPKVPDCLTQRIQELVTQVPDAGALPEKHLDAQPKEKEVPSESLPAELQALYSSGVDAAEAGQWTDAVVSFEQVLEQAPQHFWSAHNLGAAYAQLGNEGQAIMWLQRAAALNDQVPSLHYNLGMLFLETDNATQAADALKRCKVLDSDYPGIDAVLGEALLQADDTVGALEALRQAIDKRQADGKTYLALGQVLEKMERLEDAARAYRAAKEIDPSLVEAIQLLKSVEGRIH